MIPIFFQVCYQNGAWISNFILFVLTTFEDLDLFVFCNFIYVLTILPILDFNVIQNQA